MDEGLGYYAPGDLSPGYPTDTEGLGLAAGGVASGLGLATSSLTLYVGWKLLAGGRIPGWVKLVGGGLFLVNGGAGVVASALSALR